MSSTRRRRRLSYSIPELVDRAVRVLRDGGLLLFPTDTIWGIGCDATNADAVRRIYQLKERPLGKPFVLLVADVEQLKQYAGPVHPRIETLLVHYERPLTVIYDRSYHLPDIVPAPDGSVGIRVAERDDFCRMLLRELGRPVVATSANMSGAPFPQHFGEITSDVIAGVDHVVPYRQTEKLPNVPSMIVRQGEEGELEFLRT